MTACSSYGTSSSLPILPIFLVVASIVALALSMLGTGATVQITAPKPTPDPNKIGGVDIQRAVAEALSIIPTLADGGDPGYIAGGLLRVYLGWDGQIFIIGHDGAPGLLAAAEKIAVAIGAIVAP